MNLLRHQPAPLDRLQGGESPLPREAVGRGLPAGGPEQSLFRLDLRRALEMHRRLALGFAVAGLLAAGVYLKKMWPIYTAQSVVVVQPMPAAGQDNTGHMHWPYNYDATTYETYVEQQMMTITRQDVLLRAVKKLEGTGWMQPGESQEAAAARLKGSLEVNRMGTSYQVTIAAHARSAAMAATVANTAAEAYIDSTNQDPRSQDAQWLAMLKDEQNRVDNALLADREEQKSLNGELGVAAIGVEAPQHLDEDIGRLHEELTRARAAHDEAAAKLTTLGAGGGPSTAALDAEADEIVAGDPGLASLKQALDQRRAALVTQMANLTPNHPQYKQAAAELAEIGTKLASESEDLRAKAAARLKQRMRNELERTAQVESRLNGQLGGLTHAAAGTTAKLQRASDLTADITRLQRRRASVDEQLHNLLLQQGAPGTVYLSTPATAPTRPVLTGVMRNALLIVFMGIFLGLAAAVVAHKADPRVYIAADVEQVLGFAPMAVLPDFVEVSDEAGEEHLLRLAASLEYAHQQGVLKNCMITGAGPGTGVTTLATRVRTMLETMGKQTVLVDASGTPPPEEETPGKNRKGSRALARAAQMAEEVGAEEENLVITDAAPLAVSAETEYLARMVDAAIVVIESGVTTREQLRTAARTLERLEVASVGFVLNRVQMGKADAAFRQSVKAMEDHLRTQSLTLARRTERSKQAQQQPVEPPRPELRSQPAPAAVTGPAAQMHGLPPAPQGEEFVDWRAFAREPDLDLETTEFRSALIDPESKFKIEPEPVQTETAEPEPAPAAVGKADEPVSTGDGGAEAPKQPEGAAGAQQTVEAAEETETAMSPGKRDTRAPLQAWAIETALERALEPGATAPQPAMESWLTAVPDASAVSETPAPEPRRDTAPPETETLLWQTSAVAPAAATERRPTPAEEWSAESFSTYRPKPRPRTQTVPVPAVPASAPVVPASAPAVPAVPASAPAAPIAAQTPAAIPDPPAQSWERLTQTGRVTAYRTQQPPQMPQPEPAPRPMPGPVEISAGDEEPDEIASDPAARLSGLRNLLFSLGLKKLNRSRGQLRGYEDEPEETRFEPEERRVFAQPERPAPASPGPSATMTARVVARPEFLPPRPAAEASKADSRASARSNQWETYEDVDVLPSKRGQYKRL